MFAETLTITRPGTYTGTYESDDPDTPAISVRCDHGTVVIEHCTLSGVGNLIQTFDPAPHAIIIRDNRGRSAFSDRAGQLKGRFLLARKPRTLIVHNNDFRGTLGMRVHGVSPDYDGDDQIRIVRNRCLDVDGRRSDGSGGPTNEGRYKTSFFQLMDTPRTPNVVVAWNHVVNRPFESRVEDVVSMYRSGGTEDHPVDIAFNLIDGGYHGDAVDGRDFAGVGINTGDGPPDDEGRSMCGWTVARNNTVLNTGHGGISITSGSDITVRDNRVFSTSKVDGRYHQYGWAGIYVNNYHDTDPVEFQRHTVRNNVSTWVFARDVMKPLWRRQDYLLLDDTIASDNRSHTPPGEEPDPDIADRERERWRRSLVKAGITTGPGGGIERSSGGIEPDASERR